MNNLFVIFWVFLILTSIVWYAFLVFYLGVKAGREIRTMTKVLGELRPTKKDPES